MGLGGGGVEVHMSETVLFIVFKVVEFGTCESDQSEALQVVFSLLQRDRILLQEFIKLDGYAMIVKVLLTTPCIIGFEILKVFQIILHVKCEFY